MSSLNQLIAFAIPYMEDLAQQAKEYSCFEEEAEIRQWVVEAKKVMEDDFNGLLRKG